MIFSVAVSCGFRPHQGSSTFQPRKSPLRAPLIGFLPLRRFRTDAASSGRPCPDAGVRRVWLPSRRLRLRAGPPGNTFVPVRPWDSPLQGLYLRRVARTSRSTPTLVTLSLRATNFSKSASPGSYPDGSRHPSFASSAATGRCPRGVFASSRFNRTGLRVFRRAPSRASGPSGPVKDHRFPASQGHQPAGRTESLRSRPP